MGKILEQGLKTAGIEFNENTIEKFNVYRKLIVDYNRKFNLTAITGENEIERLHFLDSATIWEYVKDTESLADVGSGAGFPGIPLKILGMKGNLYLFDSLRKRIGFLTEVIDRLELTGCHPVHMRAEDAGRGEYREKFETVTARAVAKLPILSEYCIPLLKRSGTFIAMKGKYNTGEIEDSKNAIGLLGGEVERIQEIRLFGSNEERTLIKIRKIEKTPSIYPRKAGTPAKRPL
jgi:16S rRNA (guanine527-N7)-methyltransferase